jgi:hypothetical protein
MRMSEGGAVETRRSESTAGGREGDTEGDMWRDRGGVYREMDKLGIQG